MTLVLVTAIVCATLVALIALTGRTDRARAQAIVKATETAYCTTAIPQAARDAALATLKDVIK